MAKLYLYVYLLLLSRLALCLNTFACTGTVDLRMVTSPLSWAVSGKLVPRAPVLLVFCDNAYVDSAVGVLHVKSIRGSDGAASNLGEWPISQGAASCSGLILNGSPRDTFSLEFSVATSGSSGDSATYVHSSITISDCPTTISNAVHSISSNTGRWSGEVITIKGWPFSSEGADKTYCRAGSLGSSVRVGFVDACTVTCALPPVTSSQTVPIQVSYDSGVTWDGSVLYTYTGTPVGIHALGSSISVTATLAVAVPSIIVYPVDDNMNNVGSYYAMNGTVELLFPSSLSASGTALKFFTQDSGTLFGDLQLLKPQSGEHVIQVRFINDNSTDYFYEATTSILLNVVHGSAERLFISQIPLQQILAHAPALNPYPIVDVLDAAGNLVENANTLGYVEASFLNSSGATIGTNTNKWIPYSGSVSFSGLALIGTPGEVTGVEFTWKKLSASSPSLDPVAISGLELFNCGGGSSILQTVTPSRLTLAGGTITISGIGFQGPTISCMVGYPNLTEVAIPATLKDLCSIECVLPPSGSAGQATLRIAQGESAAWQPDDMTHIRFVGDVEAVQVLNPPSVVADADTLELPSISFQFLDGSDSIIPITFIGDLSITVYDSGDVPLVSSQTSTTVLEETIQLSGLTMNRMTLGKYNITFTISSIPFMVQTTLEVKPDQVPVRATIIEDPQRFIFPGYPMASPIIVACQNSDGQTTTTIQGTAYIVVANRTSMDTAPSPSTFTAAIVNGQAIFTHLLFIGDPGATYSLTAHILSLPSAFLPSLEYSVSISECRFAENLVQNVAPLRAAFGQVVDIKMVAGWPLHPTNSYLACRFVPDGYLNPTPTPWTPMTIVDACHATCLLEPTADKSGALEIRYDPEVGIQTAGTFIYSDETVLQLAASQEEYACTPELPVFVNLQLLDPFGNITNATKALTMALLLPDTLASATSELLIAETVNMGVLQASFLLKYPSVGSHLLKAAVLDAPSLDCIPDITKCVPCLTTPFQDPLNCSGCWSSCSSPLGGAYKAEMDLKVTEGEPVILAVEPPFAPYSPNRAPLPGIHVLQVQDSCRRPIQGFSGFASITVEPRDDASVSPMIVDIAQGSASLKGLQLHGVVGKDYNLSFHVATINPLTLDPMTVLDCPAEDDFISGLIPDRSALEEADVTIRGWGFDEIFPGATKCRYRVENGSMYDVPCVLQDFCTIKSSVHDAEPSIGVLDVSLDSGLTWKGGVDFEFVGPPAMLKSTLSQFRYPSTTGVVPLEPIKVEVVDQLGTSLRDLAIEPYTVELLSPQIAIYDNISGTEVETFSGRIIKPLINGTVTIKNLYLRNPNPQEFTIHFLLMGTDQVVDSLANLVTGQLVLSTRHLTSLPLLTTSNGIYHRIGMEFVRPPSVSHPNGSYFGRRVLVQPMLQIVDLDTNQTHPNSGFRVIAWQVVNGIYHPMIHGEAIFFNGLATFTNLTLGMDMDAGTSFTIHFDLNVDGIQLQSDSITVASCPVVPHTYGVYVSEVSPTRIGYATASEIILQGWFLESLGRIGALRCTFAGLATTFEAILLDICHVQCLVPAIGVSLVSPVHFSDDMGLTFRVFESLKISVVGAPARIMRVPGLDVFKSKAVIDMPLTFQTVDLLGTPVLEFDLTQPQPLKISYSEGSMQSTSQPYFPDNRWNGGTVSANAGWAFPKAGRYTFNVSSTILWSEFDIVITHGVPEQLVYANTPSSVGSSLIPLTSQPSVELWDGASNAVPLNVSNMTIKYVTSSNNTLVPSGHTSSLQNDGHTVTYEGLTMPSGADETWDTMVIEVQYQTDSKIFSLRSDPISRAACDPLATLSTELVTIFSVNPSTIDVENRVPIFINGWYFKESDNITCLVGDETWDIMYQDMCNLVCTPPEASSQRHRAMRLLNDSTPPKSRTMYMLSTSPSVQIFVSPSGSISGNDSVTSGNGLATSSCPGVPVTLPVNVLYPGVEIGMIISTPNATKTYSSANTVQLESPTVALVDGTGATLFSFYSVNQNANAPVYTVILKSFGYRPPECPGGFKNVPIGVSLSGQTQCVTSMGSCQFSNLRLTRPIVGQYNLVFQTMINGTESEVSYVVVVSHGTAQGIEFTNTPAQFIGHGEYLSPAPVVRVVDEVGNGIPISSSSDLAISLDSEQQYDQSMTNTSFATPLLTHNWILDKNSHVHFSNISFLAIYGVNYSLGINVTYQGSALTVKALTVIAKPCHARMVDIHGAAIYHERNEYAPFGSVNCTDCPDGALCNGSSILRVAPGHWRVSSNASIFYPCHPGACVDNTSTGTFPNGSCHAGYVGPLCATCAADYAATSDGSCGACPKQMESWLLLFGYWVVVVIYVLGTVLVHIPTANGPNPSVAGRIYVQWLFETALMGRLLSGRLPGIVSSIYDWHGSIHTFIHTELYLKCHFGGNTYTRWAIIMTIPALLLILFWVVHIVVEVTLSAKSRHSHKGNSIVVPEKQGWQDAQSPSWDDEFYHQYLDEAINKYVQESYVGATLDPSEVQDDISIYEMNAGYPQFQEAPKSPGVKDANQKKSGFFSRVGQKIQEIETAISSRRGLLDVHVVTGKDVRFPGNGIQVYLVLECQNTTKKMILNRSSDQMGNVKWNQTMIFKDVRLQRVEQSNAWACKDPLKLQIVAVSKKGDAVISEPVTKGVTDITLKYLRDGRSYQVSVPIGKDGEFGTMVLMLETTGSRLQDPGDSEQNNSIKTEYRGHFGALSCSVLMFALYPALCWYAVSILTCDGIKGASEDTAVWYMSTDYEEECIHTGSEGWQIVVIAVSCIYLVIYPLVLFFLCGYYRLRLGDESARRHTGFVTDGYKPQCWWWGLGKIIAILTITVILWSIQDQMIRIYLSIGVWGLLLIMTIYVHPYVAPRFQRLTVVAESNILHTLWSSLLYSQAVKSESKQLVQVTSHPSTVIEGAVAAQETESHFYQVFLVVIALVVHLYGIALFVSEHWKLRSAKKEKAKKDKESKNVQQENGELSLLTADKLAQLEAAITKEIPFVSWFKDEYQDLWKHKVLKDAGNENLANDMWGIDSPSNAKRIVQHIKKPREFKDEACQIEEISMPSHDIIPQQDEGVAPVSVNSKKIFETAGMEVLDLDAQELLPMDESDKQAPLESDIPVHLLPADMFAKSTDELPHPGDMKWASLGSPPLPIGIPFSGMDSSRPHTPSKILLQNQRPHTPSKIFLKSPRSSRPGSPADLVGPAKQAPAQPKPWTPTDIPAKLFLEQTYGQVPPNPPPPPPTNIPVKLVLEQDKVTLR